jgi:RNA polymerase sigma-70 factor (ECF subfamily)
MAMATMANRYDGLDPEVVRNIRATARRLARQRAVPGMDAEDFEQDLALDLWRRQDAFNPERASFRTFAARVVANRVATLTAGTARLHAERRTVSLHDPIEADHPAGGATLLLEVIADDGLFDADGMAIQLDIRRFLIRLSPALQRCCVALLRTTGADAAAEAGVHRSTMHENLVRLRGMAAQAGLRNRADRPRRFDDRAGRCACGCGSTCTRSQGRGR